MYQSYLLYQAERPRTPRQQRDEDIRAGQLAAAFTRLWRGRGRGPGRGLGRGPRRRPQSARPAEALPPHATAPCTAGIGSSRI
jgi:hypothetical protein